MMADSKKHDEKEQDYQVDSKEKKKFVPTKYPRPWNMELTEEQRENLKKQIEEDTKRYRELGKRMAEDKSHQELYDKIRKGVK